MKKISNISMLHAKFSRVNIALFCILILAFILRAIYLGSKSLWLDEAVNISWAEKNVYSWAFTEPPLYFIFLHFWLAVGKSEVIARFPSVIFGVLSVFTIYKIGTTLYSEKEALVSAFLLSISQTAVYFSQETRYYSLFIFLLLVSVYFFLRMEEKPTNKNKVLFLGFLTLAFYAHYFTLIVLFVFMAFKLWKYIKDKEHPKETKSFFLLVGIFCLLIAPIISNFVSQIFMRSATSYINFVYQTHLSINFIKEIFTYLIVNSFYEKESVFPYIILGLFLYGLFSSMEHFKKSAIFLMMWLFLPIAFAAILTIFISNLHIRYLVFILPALLLISSRGIVTISDLVKVEKNRVASINLNSLLTTLVLATIVFSSYPILKAYYNSENYDWRSATGFIENNAENGSNVVLVPGYNVVPFNYYYRSKSQINVLEYSSFEELVKLSSQNTTYLVITNDAFVLKPDELGKLEFWLAMNIERRTLFSNIYIIKATNSLSSLLCN